MQGSRAGCRGASAGGPKLCVNLVHKCSQQNVIYTYAAVCPQVEACVHRVLSLTLTQYQLARLHASLGAKSNKPFSNTSSWDACMCLLAYAGPAASVCQAGGSHEAHIHHCAESGKCCQCADVWPFTCKKCRACQHAPSIFAACIFQFCSGALCIPPLSKLPPSEQTSRLHIWCTCTHVQHSYKAHAVHTCTAHMHWTYIHVCVHVYVCM